MRDVVRANSVRPGGLRRGSAGQGSQGDGGWPMPRSRRLSEAGRNRRWVDFVAAALVACAACGNATSNSAGNGAHRAVLVSQPVVPVPATIDYTGTSDVTDALQSFIDGLDDGVLVRFHRNGRYRVEG